MCLPPIPPARFEFDLLVLPQSNTKISILVDFGDSRCNHGNSECSLLPKACAIASFQKMTDFPLSEEADNDRCFVLWVHFLDKLLALNHDTYVVFPGAALRWKPPVFLQVKAYTVNYKQLWCKKREQWGWCRWDKTALEYMFGAFCCCPLW